jgi:hypothetical protein
MLMECPNCTFQNSPGLKRCLRCGGLLDFSAVAVEPPRAGHGRARRRAGGAGRAAGRRVAYAAEDLSRALRCPIVGVRWSDLALSILPGLAQVRRGPRALGWALLAAWSVDLFLAAAFIGSGLSAVLCLFAVSLHCLAISLLLNATLMRMPLERRAAFGLGVYLLLLLGLYRPVGALGRGAFGWLEVSNIRGDAGILANRDVVLYTGRLTRPAAFERGDLVVYEIGRSRSGGAVIRPGLGIERVLGIPGDEVETDGRIVRVNGEELPPEQGPVGDAGRLPRMTLRASEGQYIILPTVVTHTGYANAGPVVNLALISLAVVREDHIRGRVFWRMRPWLRAGVPRAPVGTGAGS